jgi:methylmalonyl-CoA mutase N-terminal domain/subunit
MKRLVPIALALSLVLAAETRVDAYLDPGSGSMLVQLLLGGVAGAAVIMKLGWERFKGVFRSSKTKQTKPNE